MTPSTETSSIEMDTERPAKKRKITRKDTAVITPRRHTRSMTAESTDAARKAVFNTSELLENIILFLPYTDILTKVQRLSRQWKNAVASSPSIQTKLWRRAQNPTAIQPVHFTQEDTFPRSASWGRIGMPIYSHNMEYNPLCFDRMVGPLQLAQSPKPAWLFRMVDGSSMDPAVIEFFFHNRRGGQYDHDQHIDASRGSWRDMHLTEPPITTCVLHVRIDEIGSHDVPITIRDHSGLTLGLIYDTIVAGLRSSARGKLQSKRARVATFYTAFE